MEGKVNCNGNCFKGEEHVETILSLITHALGESAKLRRPAIIFITSVSPSAWNNSAPTGRNFIKFDI